MLFKLDPFSPNGVSQYVEPSNVVVGLGGGADPVTEYWEAFTGGETHTALKDETASLYIGNRDAEADLVASLNAPAAIFSALTQGGTNFFLNSSVGTSFVPLGSVFGGARAKGTYDALSAVDAGTWLGGMILTGWDGSAYGGSTVDHTLAGLWSTVSGTVSSGVVGQKLYFGGLLTPMVSFDSDSNAIQLNETLLDSDITAYWSSGTALFIEGSSGKVSVGSSTVVHDFNVFGQQLIRTTGEGAGFLIDRTDGKVFNFLADGLRSVLKYDQSAEFRISRDTRANIEAFTGAGTTVMDFASDGNIGIGTTASTALLQIGTDTTAATGGIRFGTDTNLYRSAADTLRTNDALTVDGLLTGSLGATISGATTSINASSNFATNINTGTSTGAVSIGNSAAGAISVQSGSTIGLTGTTTITGLSSGDALTVNNSTSTGNILDIQDNGTTVLAVNDGGALAFGSAGDTILTRQAASTLRISNDLAASTATGGILQLGGYYNAGASYRSGVVISSGSSAAFSGTIQLNSSGSSKGIIAANTGASAYLNINTALGINTTLGTTFGTDQKFQVNNITTVDNDAVAIIGAGAADQTALVAQAAAAQSANIFEVQASTGTVLASIGSTGIITTAATGGIRFGTDTNLYRSAADTLKTDDTFIAARIQETRITERTVTTASTASLTIDSDSYDRATVTALAADMTINAPTGTPTDGQKLLIRIKDNATARALTWNAVFNEYAVLPTTTTISKTLRILCEWNSADSTWDVLTVQEEI